LPSCATCEAIVLNRVPQSERARIHGALVHESGKVYREMIFGSFRVDAQKVRCPVLVVGGSDDRVVSVALLRATAKYYGAALKLYEGRGHWLLEEPAGTRLRVTSERGCARRSQSPRRCPWRASGPGA
jgi:pimeloyl-ACP methyl ester carboxylesterase